MIRVMISVGAMVRVGVKLSVRPFLSVKKRVATQVIDNAQASELVKAGIVQNSQPNQVLSSSIYQV